MKAIILLGTLKKKGLSNTEVLAGFFKERLQLYDIECDIVKLVDHSIHQGTYTDVGEGDAWPFIYDQIIESDIIIFATPIWWGGHSSEIQRIIERLDNVHDEILAGKPSVLEGKAGGIIITGDSDGAQHITGNISNFFNAIGITLPPYATLSVMWDGQRKGAETTKEELLEKYQKEYVKIADAMVKQLKQVLQKQSTTT
ncbi:flavodoxin family protein [Mucilaginibacter sp. HD30]